MPVIHRNLLEVRLVSNLGDWLYSNYHEWIGIRSGKLIDREFVRVYFRQPKDYVEFISSSDERDKLKQYLDE
ncbi:MAG: hypothetical protein H6696_16065 [Deferribacteres bacterium]|nr:hypothetical protein [candidate division KSB1 bacterium]MCB9503447.1 hypothetical protein [Deferribacteres bacterium]